MEMDGWMDGRKDGWKDRCMEGWMDGREGRQAYIYIHTYIIHT